MWAVRAIRRDSFVFPRYAEPEKRSREPFYRKAAKSAKDL